MSLTWHQEDQAFILVTDDQTVAQQTRADGWGRTNLGGTLSARQSALFTREPYAALDHFQEATGEAAEILAPLWAEYQSSLAKTTDFQVTVPDTLPDWFEPMDFQRAGVEYASKRKHTLIGDEMGLTKTAQSIMLANHIGAEKALVVCPASVRSQWAEQIRIWSVIPRVGRSTYPIYKSADGVRPNASWTIISYDLMRNPGIHAALRRMGFDLVIFDEAHYLKTVISKRSQYALGSLDGSIKGIAQHAERTLTLTGTPLPNRPREAYNLLRHQCWDAIDWMSEDAFIRRFNPSATMATGHVVEEATRLPELRARWRCNLMVRRLRRQVLPQLPEEWHDIVHLEPDGAIRKVLKAESLLEIDVDDWEELDFEAKGHLAVIRHEMGIAKIPRAVDRIVTQMEGGLPKLFVIAYHREVLTQLKEKLAHYNPSIIWGGQTPFQRDREKLRFINDPECRIKLGQINAVAEGLDGMQAVCYRGSFVEPSWVWKDNEQACGRLIRMGQSRGVLWEYMVAPGSLDERILGRSIQKGQIVTQVTD